ncbi:MAG: hypothetical protein COA42_06150 [Alteromonadaceae bacterium]|nr:MAG: hypothetical protein COA42_06150 [Alteromonadaceae bacterium]
MKLTTLTDMLDLASKNETYAFSNKMLGSYFPAESKQNLKKTIERAITTGVLTRACRGVYLYPKGNVNNSYTLESIALALRSGGYSYISLETALSECSIISQMTISHLTVMTTGRSQTYATPHGVVELTHTSRTEKDIIENTYKQNQRPLRIAKPALALSDLKRVNRNLHMVDMAVFNDILKDTRNEKNIAL